MVMLDLVKHPVKIAHINVRTEMHGDEERTALDVKVTADLPNTALDGFSPSLRASLFSASDDPDLLGPDDAHLPHLKNPALGTLQWAGKFSPVAFRLHTGGRSTKNDLAFADITLDKITIRPKEGGTCSFSWRLQVLPSEDEAARVMMLLNHEVQATQETADALDADETEDE
jgi:hypothetical protein